jgi:hypothetical protein
MRVYNPCSRRAALKRVAEWTAGLGLVAGCSPWKRSGPGLRLAAFSADVTVPAGHGMMGGAWPEPCAIRRSTSGRFKEWRRPCARP